MKNLPIILLALTTSFISLKAQLSTYDLSSYKLPEMSRKSLDLSFSLGEVDMNANSYTNGEKSEFEFREFSSLTFNSFVNKEYVQRNTQTIIDLPFDFSNSSEEDSEYKTTKISPSINWYLTNRLFTEDNKFTEFNVDLEYKLRREKENSSYKNSNIDKDDKYINSDFYFGLPIKTGKGRIENVQYARQAIFILEDLKKKGRISKDITHDLITRFADRIAKLQNKRYFDFRLNRIEVIESLDSFLVSENLLSEADARYFTSLTDMWMFGNEQNRLNGSSFCFVFSPTYFLSHNKSNYEYENSNSESIYLGRASVVTTKIGFEFDLEDPFKQKWQHSLSAKVYIEPMLFSLKDEKEYKRETGSSKQKDVADLFMANLRAGLSHSVGYYPNTRTQMTLGYDINYIKSINIDEISNQIFEEKYEDSGLIGNLGLDINYYISPRVRLNVYANLTYFKQIDNQELDYNFNYVMGTGLPFDVFKQTYYSYYKKIYSHGIGAKISYAIF